MFFDCRMSTHISAFVVGYVTFFCCPVCRKCGDGEPYHFRRSVYAGLRSPPQMLVAAPRP